MPSFKASVKKIVMVEGRYQNETKSASWIEVLIKWSQDAFVTSESLRAQLRCCTGKEVSCHIPGSSCVCVEEGIQ